MRKYMWSLAIGMAALAASPATAATLIGQTASGAYYFPDAATVYPLAVTTPGTFVIGAGQEASTNVEGVTTINFDFAAASLGIVFNTVLSNPTWNGSPFNGMIFSSPGFASITGITVQPSSTFAGFTASRASVVGNQLQLNWGGLSYTDGTTLNLTFAGLSGAVPEPESWALMILGIGAIGAAMRRRRMTLSFAS